MSAQPAEVGESFETIHLGGEEAAIVPVGQLRLLQAIARHASPETVLAAAEEAELAEAEEMLAAHRAYAADGYPGAVSHDVFRQELLGGSAG